PARHGAAHRVSAAPAGLGGGRRSRRRRRACDRGDRSSIARLVRRPLPLSRFSKLVSAPMARRAVLGIALATLVALPACGLIHRHHEPAPPKPIDLNHASLRKIEELPGITPSMAHRIVDGRPYST